jgi:hypothetical protein
VIEENIHPDFMTIRQLASQPLRSVVYTRTGQFVRASGGWLACNSDGDAIRGQARALTHSKLSEMGVSL